MSKRRNSYTIERDPNRAHLWDVIYTDWFLQSSIVYSADSKYQCQGWLAQHQSLQEAPEHE